ncbi:MAG: SMP-30/gluconolactonase/LRE family protein [Opitutales bacterium]|nr:SMP-30/gluconolactonase/LRE family protein [Opitutales bacterium]
MQNLPLCLRLLFILVLSLVFVTAADDYVLGPDSMPQAGVPEGSIEKLFFNDSKIYLGTERDWWIYVPAQYDPSKPACLMVWQDGGSRVTRDGQWRVPVVFDNLIHKGEMPVTIGVFINPGVVPAPHENATARYNRSFEYDSMGDRYARFLIEEMIPQVEAKYNISDDPNDRAIAGASSGAIAAFGAAWNRPDAFRRIFSTIGTYVGLRGGDGYPTLIRKTEPKPLRVFLQDGSNDLNLYGGGWWEANLDMYASLKFSNYEVKNAWGDGGHNSKHGGSILPDALRWLWSGYPAPIKAGNMDNRRTQILIEGEDWELVSEGHKFTEGPAVNTKGELFFTDLRTSEIFKVDLTGKVSLFAKNTAKANGLMFGADGRLYACANGDKEIVAYEMGGTKTTIVKGHPSNDLVILPTGGYFTSPGEGKVYHFTFDGQVKVVDEGMEQPNGVMVSPDQTLLIILDTSDRYGYSYQIQPDGSLAYKQKYYHLHRDDNQTKSGGDGLTVDVEGRVYFTTHAGVQVSDQPGRVHQIWEKPQSGWLSNAVFGGPEMNYLYITITDKVYRRKTSTRGFLPFLEPIKPPKPRL